MGKVKNLEEKKKAAKVFSRGGGGGTKGPAVVDKRNQELPCPHCDRIFKQKQRLTEHIKKQHPEEEAAATEEAAESTSAAQTKEKKYFDVGSKAGYYDGKTPRMILHEWCLQQKRPTPRFTARKTDDGGVTCKAVLKDLKDTNKDIVCFAPKDKTYASDQEAIQDAALVALHAVQGDRNLDRVLPPDFLPLWQRLSADKAQRAQRDEQRRQREEARAARSARDARIKAEQARNTQSVQLSSKQLRAVESLVREDAGGAGPSGLEEGAVAAPEVVAKLQAMGFTWTDARAAAEGVGATQEEDVAAAVGRAADWACLHVPEARLPKELRPEAGAQITVLRAKRTGAGSCAAGGWGVPKETPADVAALADMGYFAHEAESALAEMPGLRDAALAWLFCKMAESTAGGVSLAATGDMEGPTGGAAWQEEREAIEAIFPDAASFVDGGMDLTLGPDAGGGDVPTVVLHFRVPRGSRYPAELPAVGITSVAVPREALRSITRELAETAIRLLGQPMAFEIASHVSGVLSDDAALAKHHAHAPQSFISAPGAAPEPARAATKAGSEAPTPSQASEAGDAASEATLAMDAAPLDSIEDQMADMSDEEGAGSEQRSAPQPRRKERRRPQRSAAEAQRQSAALAAHAKRIATDARLSSVRRVQQALPAFERRDSIVRLVEDARVVVLSGATGCGKSTQVPQALLDAWVAAGRGGECNIICAQPRRISAVGLARRVAQERGEDVGGTIGYSVRLDSKRSDATRLLFCTTGVLLRQLTSAGALQHVTHVVVDEVHERSADSDLLLLLLRDLLPQLPHLKVVLMSATADAKLFSAYFDPCLSDMRAPSSAMVDIPGLAHPVRDLFLEEVLEMTGVTIGRSSKYAKKGGGELRPLPSHVVPSRWASGAAPGAPAPTELSDATKASIHNIDESQINYDLIAEAVAHIVRATSKHGESALLAGWDGLAGGQGARAAEGSGGAILVFLPGVEEINKTARAIAANRGVPRGSLHVLPLHGSLPPSQQGRVFDRPPAGTRKVVLATNVAETSITIDDCSFVIDTGRAKEMGYDHDRSMSRLELTWVSRAAATQRRGRAGRVRPGVCLKLYSRTTWNDVMQEHQQPEMTRTPLPSLCLRVKAALPTMAVEAALGRAMTPPPAEAVQNALALLEAMRALRRHRQTDGGAEVPPGESLLPLGLHLVGMPLDPHVGKMLLVAAVLQALDPALTIAAALSYGRSLFLSPPDKRGEVDAAKAALAGAHKSDHLAVVAAFDKWQRARHEGGRGAGDVVAEEFFLSLQALEHIRAARADLARVLQGAGFVDARYVRRVASGTPLDAADEHPADRHARSARVVKAALCAGFYPSVVRVKHPATKYEKIREGVVVESKKGDDPRQLKFFTKDKGRVFLHPASCNFKQGKFESGWLVYTECVQTSKVFIRESSMVPVYAVLLFGGELTVHHDEGLIKVDGFAEFKAPGKVAVLVRELQARVSTMLANKVRDPSTDVSNSRVGQAMHELLANDGL
ncbi:unnamed protein product [Pedinophyceae sp. YPF-701]|nr:unnamed protein product [Pedinophyceae sp. YPF-701]